MMSVLRQLDHPVYPHPWPFHINNNIIYMLLYIRTYLHDSSSMVNNPEQDGVSPNVSAIAGSV